MNLHNRKKVLRVFKILSVVFLYLLTTLWYKQVAQHNRFSSLAQKNYLRSYPIEPLRGCILDRMGIPLVQNRFTFRAIYIPNSTPGRISLETMQKCLNGFIDKNTHKKILRRKSCTIKNHLTTKELACLKKHQHVKLGIHIERGILRHYPLGAMSKRILGQAGCLSLNDLSNTKLLTRYIQHPMTLVGQSGCESEYESQLSGVYGEHITKVDAYGNFIEEIATRQPQKGDDLITTLNAPLQSYVEGLIRKARAAHAVVIHIPTGQILAMASHDDHDSNPLGALNKIIAGRFPPGSIFKIVTALCALEHGLEGFTASCDGLHKIGNHEFQCWRKSGHGAVNLEQALYKSCNVFFYQIALKLGANKILKTAKKLGLMDVTAIDLPSELSGQLPLHSPTTFKPNKPWYGADTAMLGIGQGRIIVTPIQMLQMLASLLRGYTIPPRLNLTAPPPKKTPLHTIKPSHRKTLMRALHHCVNHPHATGYHHSHYLKNKWALAGKTSTAQIRKLQKGVRQADLPWELRSHSMFIGFAPSDTPIIAIAVIGEHEMWGGGFATYIATRIAGYAYSLHQSQQLLKTIVSPSHD